MDLVKVEINECRGIRDLTLEPGGDNLVIWGYNGTGKSAIVDAIEFLLTGEIQRLRGSGTKELTLKRHGPHVDAEPGDASVKATVELEAGELVTLERTMDDPGALSVDGAGDDAITQALDAAADRHFMLTRKDILDFIQATDRDRAEQMETLLNLDDVEEARKALRSALSSAQQASNTADGNVRKHEQRVAQVLEIPAFEPDDALKKVNELREALGADPIQTLAHDHVLDGIEEPPTTDAGDEEEEGDDAEAVIAEAARTLLSATEPDEEQEYADELSNHLGDLQDDPDLQEMADRKRLLKQGSKLVGDTNECPLCGKDWDPEELAEHVQSCLEEAEQGSELLGDIETAARRLRGPASSTSAAIEEFGEATAEHELDIDLEDAKQRLTATIEFLQDPSTSHETYESDVESIPDELAIKEEREALRGLIPDEDEEEGEEAEETSSLGHWKTLSKVDDRLQGLREAQKEARTKNLVETKASHLYEAYIEARDDELDDLYADLSERFSELYEAVHGPDEGDFEATLDPEGAGVYMEVPFYGRGSYPPNALHSEGHQDSMGLCLFFALREHLPGQTIPLVLLDDVVMSIDAGHRRDVARLLRQEFDDLQLLITTHDKNWARQLRTEDVVNRSSRLDLFNWDVETGPAINTVGDFLAKVRDELQRGDVNAAAARLRRGAEAYFADACHNLQAEVVFDRRHRWTLADLLPAAVSRLGELITDGNRWASQENQQEAQEMLQTISDKRGKAKSTLDLERWALNPAVHYSRWEDLSPGDFRTVVDAMEQLFEIFSCEECGSQLKIIEQDHEAFGVACAQKCTTWFLREE